MNSYNISIFFNFFFISLNESLVVLLIESATAEQDPGFDFLVGRRMLLSFPLGISD